MKTLWHQSPGREEIYTASVGSMRLCAFKDDGGWSFTMHSAPKSPVHVFEYQGGFGGAQAAKRAATLAAHSAARGRAVA